LPGGGGTPADTHPARESTVGWRRRLLISGLSGVDDTVLPDALREHDGAACGAERPPALKSAGMQAR